nr:hypothetical protein [uncultured Flavobacterium sp.]
MKFIKVLILFFITIITSASILFDWSDYAHVATLKNTGYTILDKYDEITTSHRTTIYELNSQVAVPLSKDEFSNSNFNCKFINLPDYFTICLQYSCKIKSYLHLLQLF